MASLLPAARLGLRANPTTPFRAATVFATNPYVTQQLRYRTRGGSQMMFGKMDPVQSHRVAGMEEKQIPPDMGLFQHTWVRPTGENLPSWFKSPKLRLRMELAMLTRHKLRNLKEWAQYCWKVKGPHWFWHPKEIVKDLHQDMYEAFARGDRQALEKLCGAGLLDQYLKRLLRRPKGQHWEWKLLSYKSPIKMVSNRGHFYLEVDFARRQSVLRVHSMQSLKKWDANGKVIDAGEPREVVEYVVIERKKLKHEDWSPWFVWGLTKETSAEEIVQGPEDA